MQIRAFVKYQIYVPATVVSLPKVVARGGSEYTGRFVKIRKVVKPGKANNKTLSSLKRDCKKKEASLLVLFIELAD